MKVQFKHPRAIDGKEYGTGVHDIQDTHQNHWYLNALVEAGDVVILDGQRHESALQGSKTPPQGTKTGNQAVFNDANNADLSNNTSGKSKQNKSLTN